MHTSVIDLKIPDIPRRYAVLGIIPDIHPVPVEISTADGKAILIVIYAATNKPGVTITEVKSLIAIVMHFPALKVHCTTIRHHSGTTVMMNICLGFQ